MVQGGEKEKAAGRFCTTQSCTLFSVSLLTPSKRAAALLMKRLLAGSKPLMKRWASFLVEIERFVHILEALCTILVSRRRKRIGGRYAP